VFIGSIASNAISFFIVVACAATLWVAGNRNITSVRDAAEALKPVASSSSYVLFAIGLFNASAVGAVIVPLSTAYAVTEAIGSESGLGRKIREAPLFIGVFTTLIVFAVVVTLLVPENRLLGVITGAQILNGLLLPTILVLMLLLINRRSVMGDYVNKFGTNLVALITIAAVAILSIMSVIYTFI
jgi:Mn2+/Fe2+ NRAMP family transporter